MIRVLITDPLRYGRHPAHFSHKLCRALLKHRPDIVIIRDKKNNNPAPLIHAARSCVERFPGTRLYINGRIDLAQQLNIGVHLTSMQHHQVSSARRRGLKNIVSTHTRDKARRCAKAGADFILYSPVFRTPGKGEPKGLEGLKQILATISRPVIALGGITTDEDLEKVAALKPAGFASIRYFLPSFTI